MTPRSTRSLALALAAALVFGCSPERTSPSPTAPGQTTGTTQRPVATAGATATPTRAGGQLDLSRLRVTLRPFAEVPGQPLAMVAPDDGSGRIFVAAQDGRIWAVAKDGEVGSNPMIDLSSRLVSGGEQGLLGLALHPDFPNDPRVFVNYTNRTGDTIVASLEVLANEPGRIDPDSFEQLLFIDQPYANHNGGDLLFGPDGYLYVFMGDGGAGGDPHGNGQSLGTLLGKVLRLDIDRAAGDVGYVSPADNPFVGRDGMDEIWHFGLRNPWRASFDRDRGDLWIGDVGQGAWEEVDVARAGQAGLNFGWNRLEGSHCFQPQAGCDRSGLTPPITEYGHDVGCTVIGGYVYRGAASPAMQGAYLLSDYCSGRIWAIDASASQAVSPTSVGAVEGNPSAFGEDLAGELYLLTLNGPIYRIGAGQG